LQAQLMRRLTRVEQLRADYQLKLDRGDGNILDLNKVRLQAATLKQAAQSNTSTLAALELQLVALNGGFPLAFADTVYPPMPEIGTLAALEEEVEAEDPTHAMLAQEVAVAKQALQVTKTLKLPRVEVGYHYQGILGQQYNGVHAGLSLPLWERRHTTEAQEAAIALAGSELLDHHHAHTFRIRELYRQYENLEPSLAELSALVKELNNEPLLAKALAFGEISVIVYFMEMGYADGAMDQLLEVEHRFQAVLAEMMQHRLN
jgi:outer membrane protein, heavy metal efflux system